MKFYNVVELNEETVSDGTIINFKSFYSSDTGDRIEPGKYIVTTVDEQYVLTDEEKGKEFSIKMKELDILLKMDLFVNIVKEN